MQTVKISIFGPTPPLSTSIPSNTVVFGQVCLVCPSGQMVPLLGSLRVNSIVSTHLTKH